MKMLLLSGRRKPLSSSLCMIESRQVKDEDVAVDRDTGATAFWWALEGVDILIYMNTVRLGRQRRKPGKSHRGSSRNNRVQKQSQTGETQTGILLMCTPTGRTEERTIY